MNEYFHTGFVVPRLEDAMDELSQVLPVTWRTIVERTTQVRGPDGPLIAPMRFVGGSLGIAPYLELLEPAPGTVWDVPRLGDETPTGAHHVGTWCDDLRATSQDLSSRGFPLRMTLDDTSGEPRRFAYHRLPSGLLVELVDASLRSEIEGYFDGTADEYPAALRDSAV